MLYGSLFMLCGAYTLAQNATLPGGLPLQLDAAAYAGRAQHRAVSFLFVPGIAALIYAGYDYAADSWRIAEHSNVTADGPPVYR